MRESGGDVGHFVNSQKVRCMNFRVRHGHITSCRLKRSHLQPVAEQNIAPSRLRNSTTPSPLSLDDSERTRSYNTKSKPQPKELDSDDEDLVFNNQFTLRMPPREDCDKLKKSYSPPRGWGWCMVQV